MHILPSIQKHRRQLGFTLIELMVAVLILAIISAIAIPSYRQYVVRNAEREAQAKMLDLQIQLEQWRAKALTYRGFQPKKVSTTGTISYAYDADNKTIYVPSGSTVSNYRYKITLVDSVDTTKPLYASVEDETKKGTTEGNAKAETVDTMTGRSWKMMAEPNTTGITSTAHTFMITSQGLRCQSKDKSITIASSDCGTGQQTW